MLEHCHKPHRPWPPDLQVFSVKEALQCQVFTLLEALHNPLDRTPVALSQRRARLLGKDPTCVSGGVYAGVYNFHTQSLGEGLGGDIGLSYSTLDGILLKWFDT